MESQESNTQRPEGQPIKTENINAREHIEGMKIPEGWWLFKTDISIMVDGVAVKIDIEIQASNTWQASQYVKLFAEHEGAINHKSVIQKVK